MAGRKGGPATVVGKRAASRNALTHGITSTSSSTIAVRSSFVTGYLLFNIGMTKRR